MEINKPNKEQLAANIPESTTTIILPNKIFQRATGVVRRVSIVPLSFSPVKRSIAGYIHPIKPKAIKIYGKKPPAIFPIIFSLEAQLL